MNTRLHTVCLAIALAFTGGGYAQADELTFSYGEPAYNIGTGSSKAETIDVALHLSDPALVGLEVQGLRIPLTTLAGITAARAWLATELPTISKSVAGTPDVLSIDFTPTADGYYYIYLPEPYTITEAGIYVGYSVDMQASDVAPAPIALTNVQRDGGLYIHSTKIYRTAWHDLSTSEGALALQVVLGGEQLKTNAVAVTRQPDVNVLTGMATTVSFDITNHGTAGATSIDYKLVIQADGEVHPAEISGTDHHADVALAPIFAATQTVQLTIPAIEVKGQYHYYYIITDVNGQPNEDINPMSTASLNAYNTLPVHRPVLEEYTGTWCGYCPRGFVGLEEMARLYPADFIGISYHNGDPMQITTQYPNNVVSFPDAWLDRWYQTDAFCGDSDYGLFGIDKVWQQVREVFTPASVEVGSEWTDGNTLHATAAVTFPLSADECPFEVGFALVADGLSGDGSDWQQSNYYAGDTSWPASMHQFTHGTDHVAGLTYNFVLIARSGVAGLPGSLSSPIEEDVAQTVSYDFDLSAIKAAIVPADHSKLRVVAMLIDSRTGAIVNANMATAGTATAAVGSLPATAADVAVSVMSYDLAGRRMATTARGISLRVERTAGGRMRVGKVMR